MSAEIRRRVPARAKMADPLSPVQVIIERECEVAAARVHYKIAKKVRRELARLRVRDPWPEFL